MFSNSDDDDDAMESVCNRVPHTHTHVNEMWLNVCRAMLKAIFSTHMLKGLIIPN